MADEVLEEKEWTVEEYLAQFDAASPDYALIRQRSANLKSIVVKKLRTPFGQMFEDTVFFEKTGLSYTIRSRL
jgi:hypothetical protein